MYRMDSDFGVWIYLIIIIISVIAGFFGKNKKTAAKSSAPGSPPPVNPPAYDIPKDLKDLFDFGSYETPQTKKAEVTEEYAYETIEKNYPASEEKPIDTYSEDKTSIEADTQAILQEYLKNKIDSISTEGERAIKLDEPIQLIEDTVSESELKSDLESFDLRKAVIYSEIVNRKY